MANTVSFGVISSSGKQSKPVNQTTLVYTRVVGPHSFGTLRNVSSPELPHFVTRRRSSAA